MSLARAELHNHTDYSLLDGLGKIPEYVARAKRIGIAALAITDHGTMGGVYEHYIECRKAEIEPILGLEAYFVPSASEARQFKDAERFHVTLLAKGERGYRVLKELNSEASRNFYYKPLIDRAMCGQLGTDVRDLVVLSGCAGSIISQAWINPDNAETTFEEIEWWATTFPNFYFEAQWHDISVDRLILDGIRAAQNGVFQDIDHVFTNDCHYCNQRDAEAHDALLAIQTAANIDDPDRFRFDGHGYHLRNRREIYRAATGAGYSSEWVKAGLDTSLAIARDCYTRIPSWEQRNWHIPKYPRTDNANALLTRLVRRGLHRHGLELDSRYVRRAKQELRKIKEVGIADFMLIDREIKQWAANKGIRVGPGRGSVCGSLVAYLIGMHKVDPIRADLRFERFINPERPKMPDVDSDYPPSRREEVIEHIRDVYGAENVMQVAAYQTMKVRGTFRKLARAHGMEWGEINRISTKLNPTQGHPDDDENDDDLSVLPPEVRENYPDIHEQIKSLIGTKSAISSHAAGILIFDPSDDVKDLIPQMWLPNQKKLAASFDLKSTEKIGLMKEDCLVLRTLDTIQTCIDLLSEIGITVEPDDWVPDEEEDDAGVYAMLGSGRTAGIFQMEGGTNTRGIQDIKCSNFESIVSCTSLYRAGPISAGAPQRYLKNKKNKKIRVAHPCLAPILANSWGEMIYQEQMMDICRLVAGFSWADTDDVKEIVRFKNPDRMVAYKDKFIQGCQDTSGIDENTALEIWAMIESQSSYLYNRSHAYAYSLLTYQTARLKYLYPLQYMTAYMATVEPDTDAHKANRGKVLSEAHERDYKILPPDINLSGTHMTCGMTTSDYEGEWMRFGFTDLKGIGESKAKKLIAGRMKEPAGFYGVKDVVAVTDKGTLNILGSAGVLATIGGPRVALRDVSNYIDYDFTDRMAKFRPELRSQVQFPERDGRWSQVAGELVSVEKRATKRGNRPFRIWRLKWDQATTFTITLWEDASEAWDTPVGSIVAVEGKYNREFDNIGVSDPGYVNILQRPRT